MTSIEKNQIHIDNEALSVLENLELGLLHPIVKLGDNATKQELAPADLDHVPFPILLAPSGKRNAVVLENAKRGEELDIYTDKKCVGTIKVDKVFPIDKMERFKQIGGVLDDDRGARLLARLGDFALSGDFKLFANETKKHYQKVQDKIKELKPKKITGMCITAEPMHKARERIIREELDNCDLLVLFLYDHYQNSIADYDIRYECINFIAKNYLISSKILIVPLRYTYLFSGQNKMILNAIMLKNYGCNAFAVNSTDEGLGIYFDNNQLYSVFDSYKDIGINIKIINEYVYCDTCRCLVKKTSCPHGDNHHIKFNANSIMKFFELGIIPPEVLVRKEISSILMTTLHKNKIKNLNSLYHAILPGNGILTQKSDRDLYLKIAELYNFNLQ